jgi:uncharacterized delta-60 repeat protein
MKKLYSVRTIILAGSLLLQLSTLCFHSRGTAGDVDLSFDPGSGVNGTVNSVAVQPDGKVIIGGEFTTVKGLERFKVARLNADGSGDSSFNPGASLAELSNNSWSVYSVALQSDGKVLIGGVFIVGGFNGIARLNADGSLDSSFDPIEVQAVVSSIALQSDGKVLIGGGVIVGGSNIVGVARLNGNGSFDSSFNPGAGEYGSVLSLALQPDGKVLVGGDSFTRRLNANGSLDGSFNPGTGVNAGVRSVALQADGKVLIGGWFSSVNGTNRNGTARLNANGSLDGSFNPGAGAFSDVHSVALQPDGKVLIGGNVSVARLNANGSLDDSFNAGTGANNDVNSVVVQSDGKVLIGGYFTSVNGTNRNRIARLNANGSLDGSFEPGRGIESYISSLVMQSDGKVLIGGLFTYVNGTNRNGSARLNADGSLDSTFVPDTNFNPGFGVIHYHQDCGVPPYQCYDIAYATAIAVQSDGKVLVGVESDYYYGCDYEGCAGQVTTYYVTRLNANGSPDTSSNPTNSVLVGRVQSIVVQPDGKVLVGCDAFTSTFILRLNADCSPDTSFNPGTGPNAGVTSVAVQPDGKVVVAGNFNTVNGTNRIGIARLNANGSLDTSFNPGTGAFGVSSVASQPDGKVLIGGYFAAVNGTNRNNIARLDADGSLDLSFSPGTGANGEVRSIALQSDGNVLIGSDFTTVNGVVRPHVARLYRDSVAPSLNIARSNAFVIVSWPLTGLSFHLQQSTNLSLPNAWAPVAQPAVTNAGQVSVTVPTSAGRKFFQLKSQ